MTDILSFAAKLLSCISATALLLATPCFADHEPRTEVPPSFPEVKLVSSFAYDYGYMLMEIKVGGRSFSPRDQRPAATERELELRHWRKLARAERERLAMAWTSEILLRGEAILDQAPPEFAQAGKPFAAPTVTTGTDGSVTIELWQQGRPGMRRGHSFYHHTYVFSSAGKFSQPDEDALDWRWPSE